MIRIVKRLNNPSGMSEFVYLPIDASYAQYFKRGSLARLENGVLTNFSSSQIPSHLILEDPAKSKNGMVKCVGIDQYTVLKGTYDSAAKPYVGMRLYVMNRNMTLNYAVTDYSNGKGIVYSTCENPGEINFIFMDTRD